MTALIKTLTLLVSSSPVASVVVKATLFAAVALVGARIARRSSAATRHVLLAAAFVVLLALPVASIIAPAIRVPMIVSAKEASAPSVAEIVTNATAPMLGPGQASTPEANGLAPRAVPLSTLVALAWAGGVAVFIVPVVVGIWQSRALRRSGLPWRHGQAVVDQLAREAAISRQIALLLHESVPGPMTCGLRRPTVVLPLDAPLWATEDFVRAIVHELEHVRRGDWASQCLARIVCAVYWFHPLVWIALRQLALEAERACDDAVLRGSEATAYADQLVELARRLSHTRHLPVLAMANRSDLAARVNAVLDDRQSRGRAGTAGVLIACAAAFLLVVFISPLRIVAAQQPAGPKPKYDVATIKPCEAEERPAGARGAAGGTNASISPGRFFVPCVTTEQLIYLAYASYGATEDQRLANDDFGTASNDSKIRGGPAWVHSLKEKYSIEATAAGATERTVLMGYMLQSLLEDRFKLKTHRETEDVPLLVLTVGKNGLKLKPMKDGDCDPNGQPGPIRQGAKPLCGNLMMLDTDTVRWTFGGFKLSSLASQLSRTLGVHVIDQTGVNDQFVFTFEFKRGQDDFETQANARAAVEDLGLKLDHTKGPRGFIVIDHIERPTPDGVYTPTPVEPRGASPRGMGPGR